MRDANDLLDLHVLVDAVDHRAPWAEEDGRLPRVEHRKAQIVAAPADDLRRLADDAFGY